MAEKILKGFRFENGLVDGFSTSSLEKDYIYFIRTSEDYKEGYIYFNGKSYGNSEELKSDLLSLSGATIAIDEKLSTLIQSDEGLSIRAIASSVTIEEIAKLIDGAPDKLDTLKEIADWIESSSGTSVELVADVQTLKNDVTSLQNKNSEIDAQISDLENQTSEISDGLVTIKADIQKSKNDIASLSGATSALTAEDLSLSERITKLEEVSGNSITNISGDSYVKVSKDRQNVALSTNVSIDLSDSGLTEGSLVDAKAAKDYIDATKEDITRSYEEADSAINSEVTNLSEKVGNLSEQIGQIVGSQVTYSAGDGIKVEANGESGATISAKIAEGTSENVVSGTGKNFLKVDSESGLSVKGVDADAAVVISDIVVAGLSGQLGSGEYKNGSIIKAGTSLQEILQNLFCKELWSQMPTVKTEFTVTVASPTLPITTTGPIEVGSAVEIGQVNANPTTGHTQSYSVGTFDYGYAWDNQGSGATTAKTYTQTLTPTPSEDGQTNALSQSFSNFKNETGGTITTVSGVDTLPSIIVYAAEGSNSVTVSQTGWTYNSESVEPKTMYIATNLGNYYKEDKESDNTIEVNPSFIASKTATSKSSYNVNAYYAYFSGFTAAMIDYSNLITSRDLAISELGKPIIMSSNKFTISSMKSTAEKPSHVIVLPSNYTIASMKNSFGSDVVVSDNYKVANTFEYVNGPFRTNYTVYVLNAADSIEYKDIVITKS